MHIYGLSNSCNISPSKYFSLCISDIGQLIRLCHWKTGFAGLQTEINQCMKFRFPLAKFNNIVASLDK